MILSDLSEEKILKELIAERKIVAKEAQKIAEKEVAHKQKAGLDGVDKLYLFPYEVKSEKLQNKWLLGVVVNMSWKPRWYHEATCCVESEFGTKDYYMVRGNMFKKPYFIKITAHAMKRFGQRRMMESLHFPIFFEFGLLSPYILKKGEVITWMLITKPQLLKMALASEERYILPTLFYTFHGCYMGQFTKNKNVVFKTYLSHDKPLKSDEEQVARLMCKIGHVGLNEKLYDKDYRIHFFDKPFNLPIETHDMLYDFGKKYRLLP